MLLKFKRTLALAITLGLCVSSAQPLTESAARNRAIISSIVLGGIAGTCAGFGADSKTSNHQESVGIGVAAGVAISLISYLIIHNILYKYTPTPTLEQVERIIKEVEQDSEFAKNFTYLTQDKILAKLSGKTNLKEILKQFDKLDEKMDTVKNELSRIKQDLDNDSLKKFYKKVHSNSKELINYLNLRVILITLAFATTDKLLTTEYKYYTEFGVNGQPSISDAQYKLIELNKYIRNTENLLTALKTTVDKNKDLGNSIYTIEELEKSIKFLKSLCSLRIAQIEAFIYEKAFSTNIITCRMFNNSEELSNILNAHSDVSWPLLIAKDTLNNKLSSLRDLHQTALQPFNEFQQSQQEYKQQSSALLIKLQNLIYTLENNLALTVKAKDYNYQVGLFEQHQEMERQRKLEEERIRRQEEMERRRLEQEQRLQAEKIAHEQIMAWEKENTKRKNEERKRKHEKELLDKKLEHEKQLQYEKEQLELAKMYQKQNKQKTNTPSTTTYNTYYTSVATAPTTTIPTYTTGYDMPEPRDTYSTGYENTTPSAPPIEPEEAYLFTNTVPEYNPNYQPSAPPADEDDTDQPPSYESLYPSSSNYAPSAPPMD